MKSRKFALALLVAALAYGVFAAALQHFRPHALTEVSICMPQAMTSALPVLAEKLDYFIQEGLKVDFDVDGTGKTCVEGLIAKQYDFAVSAVAPVVDAIIMANPLVVVSELHNSAHQAGLVYHHTRRDSGDAFVGGRVAVASGTDGELFLRLYAKEHAPLSISQMKVVKTHSYKEAAELLEKGAVQGAVLREPHLSEFVHAYPASEFINDESAFYTGFSLLLSHADYSAAHPEIVERALRAMLRAQKFAERYPARARTVALEAMKIEDSEALREFWPKIHLGLGLSSVLLAMMNQAEATFTSIQDFAPAETSNINIFASLYPQALRKLNIDLVTYE